MQEVLHRWQMGQGCEERHLEDAHEWQATPVDRQGPSVLAALRGFGIDPGVREQRGLSISLVHLFSD